MTIDEHYTLIWLYNECTKFFQNNYLIGASKPYIPNEDIDLNWRFQSGYCNPSKNNLSHEIQSTPIEIVDFITDNDNIDIMADSYVLKKYLEPIIDKNNIINELLSDILPMELIDEILKYLWDDCFKEHYTQNNFYLEIILWIRNYLDRNYLDRNYLDRNYSDRNYLDRNYLDRNYLDRIY